LETLYSHVQPNCHFKMFKNSCSELVFFYLHAASSNKLDDEIGNIFGYMMRRRSGDRFLLSSNCLPARPKLVTSCNPLLCMDFSLWTQCQGSCHHCCEVILHPLYLLVEIPALITGDSFGEPFRVL
jgi:hypothetical protein